MKDTRKQAAVATTTDSAASPTQDNVTPHTTGAHEFRVTIFYREPTYDVGNAPRAAPYRWTTNVVAKGAEAAREHAIRIFEDTAARSSVSYPRKILFLNVTLL